MQQQSRPARMSEVPVENRKPSILIELLVWIAFAVPIIFLWFAFQSLIMIGVIIAIRILIMGLSHYDRHRKSNTARSPKQSNSVPIAVVNTEVTKPIRTNPFIEEAISEINWLLEKLHMRNEQEEMRLSLYRKMRGWD